MHVVRFSAAATAFAAALAFVSPSMAQQASADDRLDRAIDTAMEAEGPWLLPAEQALIERKCGYARGARESESLTMNDGVLICANGRRVDDPEVRAMVAEASPRISRRVNAVMKSAAVRNAIAAVTEGAVREALETVREALPPRRGRRR